MDFTKLAVILTGSPEDAPEALQNALQNVRDFWSAGAPPFTAMLPLTPEGLEHAPLAEQKNHCLALAAENNAGWCLVLNPGDWLAPHATEELQDHFAVQQGVWGVTASYLPEEQRFSLKLPQILELADYQELLYFDPLLTLSGPYFVRTDAALETGFNPDYPLGHDLQFAIRFWARWKALKTPVLIGGSQREAFSNETLRDEYGEILLAAREEVGLRRETPEVVETINAKTRQLQAYCRGKQAISADHLTEIRALIPYRGLLDVTISPEHGFMLASNNDDAIAEHLAWRGKYKPMKTAVWTVLAAQNPGIVLDCGAYNGFYGLVAATICPQSQVYCFEPEREAFARTVQNIKVNNMRNMQVVQYALDVAPGLATLYRLEETDGLCLQTSIHPDAPCPVQDGQPVHAINLDSFLLGVSAQSGQELLTLVKMDLCGQESQALQGMAGTLCEQRPILLLTVSPRTNTRIVEQLLLACGYALYVLDEQSGQVEAFESFPADLRHTAEILAAALSKEELAAQLEMLREE